MGDDLAAVRAELGVDGAGIARVGRQRALRGGGLPQGRAGQSLDAGHRGAQREEHDEDQDRDLVDLAVHARPPSVNRVNEFVNRVGGANEAE